MTAAKNAYILGKPDRFCFGVLTRRLQSTYTLSMIWASTEKEARKLATVLLDKNEADQVVVFRQLATYVKCDGARP